MFSQVCVCSTFGGGYPIPGLAGGGGGTSIPGLAGEVSHLRLGRGVPHPSWGGCTQGIPPTRSGWGTPQTWDRVPPPDQVWMGYPPDQVWMGYSPRTWDRVPPQDLGQGNPPRTWDGVPPDLGWGTPQTWDGVTSQTWDRVPPAPRPGTGYHPPPPDQVWIRQSSTASTCYVAGGVPLAFTQENFLVLTYILNCTCRYIQNCCCPY